MRFESLGKSLLVLAIVFLNYSSFAKDVNAISLEDEIPEYVDGAAVDEACDRIPDEIDYVEWEKSNVSSTQLEQTRKCAEQTDALQFVMERNIKRCDLYTKACYRTAKNQGSEAAFVEGCHQATIGAEEKIASVQKDFDYLKVINKSCHREVVRMCNDNPKSKFCTDDFRSFGEREPGDLKQRIVDRIDKTTRRVERLGRRVETAGEIAGYVQEGKTIIEGQEASSTTTGNTNIQQSYGPGADTYAAYGQYQGSRSAASENAAGRAAPVSAPTASSGVTSSGSTAGSVSDAQSTTPSTSGSSSSISSGVLGGLKKVGQAAQSVVTNSGVLATTGLLRDQYLQKKDAKKSQVERQAALDQANALSAQSEVQNNLLKIKESNSASSGSTRPATNGRTGVGSGGTPRVSNVAGSQSQQTTQGNQVAFSSANSTAVAARAPSSPSASGASSSASPLSSSGGGSGSQSRGTSSAGSSSSGVDQNLQKYTKDRGFFGALARAFGYKKKKAAASASKVAKANTVELAPKGNITQALNKRWNRTLRRVEAGSSRGLASVGNQDHGMTAKNRSIFGSICNRYSSFRKESQLGAGRAVCPGN